jgi:hypothetical protein
MELFSSLFARLRVGCGAGFFFVLALGLAAGLTGCGSASAGFSGNTEVTVLASGEANDQLLQVSLGFTNFTLTSQSGETISLMTTPQAAEFIHLNGTAEPLFTAGVPQGVYTAATATIGVALIGCAAYNPITEGLDNSNFQYGNTPSSQVTVKLPAPITIAGDAMDISLNLLVSQSVTLSACFSPNGIYSYSIDPTFNLVPVTISQKPTNNTNGRLVGLAGLIESVNRGGFVMAGGDGPVWTVDTNGSTTYQRIAGVSALAAGMAVDMDAAVQFDGSLLATRVEVEDANPVDLSLWNGPVESVNAIIPVLNSGARQEQGFLFASTYLLGGASFSFGNAVFQTSGQLSNLSSLPFPATFNAANVVAGQNVNVTTHAASLAVTYPTYIPATTVTLIPQSIDGTVSAVSSESGFTVYTVALAASDLFPNLAVQAGQTTLLTNPGTVEVYVDNTTQMLNSEAIGVGSIVRFNGLMFNDNGTLRMDCAEVNDGVPE